MRRPTVEWQVCGACNYDCSYCIQSRSARVGHPTPEQVEMFLQFFTNLPGTWEIKMTGGEPFAFKDFLRTIIPGLIERTGHTVSVLTNLSAPPSQLRRFAQLTRGRLGIVSASLHREFAQVDEFAHKARALRAWMDPEASLVINSVMLPGQVEGLLQVREVLGQAGLRLFPQWLKVKNGRHRYEGSDEAAVAALVGEAPTPSEANLAPSYHGQRCWVGVDYFVALQNGDCWSCRTARRHQEGYLGNIFADTVRLWNSPHPCPYHICPCTVPANRGMIEASP